MNWSLVGVEMMWLLTPNLEYIRVSQKVCDM